MTLKSQNNRQYRGLIWIGRLYRLAGWLGLTATVFFTVWGFVSQWQNMSRYWGNVDFWTLLTQSLLVAFMILITGLALSAVAFGISLGVQVGLTIMRNSQTQVELLRRLAQTQGEIDSSMRLQDNISESSSEHISAVDVRKQRHHS